MKYFLTLFLALLIIAPKVNAQEVEDIPLSDKLRNFSVIYVAQWAFYLVSQEETIREEGSFKNWYEYMVQPDFDKDSFEYNIYKHTFSGASYYLFYRAYGHDLKGAFVWTFFSSLAFEFTVETATEKPSFQDIYQTPVYGTILGIGLEKTSDYFHSLDTWYGNALAYLFNPMKILPNTKHNTNFSMMPIISNDSYGAIASYRF